MRYWARLLFFIWVVKPLLMLILGLNLYGKENLPRHQQFIMVANHNSHLDTAALLSLFPLSQLEHIRPVAAEDYFSVNPLLAFFSRTFFNILPIARTNITRTNNPITRMCEVIDSGGSLIVFPEGSRGEPEKLAEFQTGIAHLIHKYPQIPVVPVYMEGMGRSLPKGEFLLVPFFCDLIIGPSQHISGNKLEITATLETLIRELREAVPR